MTLAEQIEYQPLVAADTGCLAAVPAHAREAANDNTALDKARKDWFEAIGFPFTTGVVGHVGPELANLPTSQAGAANDNVPTLEDLASAPAGSEVGRHRSLRGKRYTGVWSILKIVPGGIHDNGPAQEDLRVLRDGKEMIGFPHNADGSTESRPRANRLAINFDHLPRVIALSGAAGSGKSTVSDFLAVRFGYGRSKFATPLKNMCRALGMSEDMIEGDQKEVPQAILGGQTPRHAMQTLGTEWGRNCMGDDFWVDRWAYSNRGQRVVVDDCRFANEAGRVRRMGGRVIRLTGRGGIAGGHASEQVNFIADAVIENTGTILDLQQSVLRVIEGWRDAG